MAIKKYKSTSPGRRNSSVNLHSECTTSNPEKSLLRTLKKTGGRNHSGKITSRHRGGGHKRRYRLIDFKRSKDECSAEVMTIEYDPNRSCNISLVKYEDGEKRYILAPQDLAVGTTIYSGIDAEPRVGNCLFLSKIPLGMAIHNIEMTPGKGGQLVRGAGNAGKLIARNLDKVIVLLPSGETRYLNGKCRATIGAVGNNVHASVRWGQAGRNRHRGRRPHVRGMCQNPVDHPMGGGEGRRSGGRDPVSPTGKLAKGGKTRSKHKTSNKQIIRRRKNKRYGQLVL